MKPLAANTLLQNRYKIVHLIGKGGMGEVYLAVDERLGSAMALKRTTVGDDPMLAEAFEREARTLANLRHNVLPKVSDHFIENEQQYLVMEHISGDDLSQRLKESEKPFPLNWVMFWADQLLEALTYLHTNEPPIIHRDIKPQNLKLTDDNHIVLLDFGLSKHALGQTRVTTSGSVVGYTPHYAPMEQIRGTGTNAKSDLYSLSATLYQLLTGVIPADALTRADSLLASMSDPLEPIYKINSEVPQSISDIILKGMELSLDKRPENAREMQKALRRAFNNIQSSMSAQTVAFNIEDVEDSEDSENIGEKTEVMSDLPPLPVGQFLNEQADDPGMKTEVIPDKAFSDKTENEITKDYAEKDFSTKDDFQEIPSDLSGEKYKTSEDFEFGRESTGEDFSTNEGFSNEEEFSPEATVPLISMDNQDKTNDFQSFDSDSSDKDFEEEKDETDSAASGAAGNFTAADQNFQKSDEIQSGFDSQAGEKSAPTPSPETAKSSTGKYVAILGGLGVVLFLIVGTALAFGWYYMYGGAVTAEDTNTTATPQPSIEPTPNVEPTPAVADADTTDNANTEANSAEDLANANATDTTGETGDKKVKSTKPSTPARSTPKPTPRIAGKKTPVAKPTPKPSPKKTPVKGGRTDIIQ